ncbi:MAG: hypothetical protein AAFV25_03935, partial [Bacteroidota bacterium]
MRKAVESCHLCMCFALVFLGCVICGVAALFLWFFWIFDRGNGVVWGIDEFEMGYGVGEDGVVLVIGEFDWGHGLGLWVGPTLKADPESRLLFGTALRHSSANPNLGRYAQRGIHMVQK